MRKQSQTMPASPATQETLFKTKAESSTRSAVLSSSPKKAGRIVEIDIIRGFALFGILIVNLFYLGVPDAYYTGYFERFTGILNRLIVHSVNFLFTGKFYPIFSCLFGLAFFIQFSSARQKGINVHSFFFRRLTALLLFGVAHIVFVWEEDILLFYALFGFALIFLADRSPRVIIITAGMAYMLFVLVEIPDSAHLGIQKYNPFHSLEEYIFFYTHASYWEILQVRLSLYADKIFQPARFIHHFDRLAFFLIGLYAGKKHLVDDISARRRHWMHLWIVAFVFGILLQILWIEKLEDVVSVPLIPATRIIANLLLFAQICTYIVGVLLLLSVKRIKDLFQIFAYPGKMALTNYLMHTTLFSLLFYSYGLGLYGSLSPVQLIVISIGVFLFQVILSKTWLHYFSYGPLEWIWRSFTYKKFLPIKKHHGIYS